MCGRYHQHKPREALELMFEIGQVLDDPSLYAPRYNIAPTQRAPVIRALPDGTRTLEMLQWGLIPRWAKPETARKDAARALNARAETAPSRPTFREAVHRRRCLVPATGFYEWRQTPGAAGVKQPFNLTPATGVFFAFGGLWETWQPPEGPSVSTFTIMTCAANADLSDLHDRMPVIVPATHWSLWLDPRQTDLAPLAPLVEPSPTGTVARALADPRVNAVRNEGPELLLPPQGLLL